MNNYMVRIYYSEDYKNQLYHYNITNDYDTIEFMQADSIEKVKNRICSDYNGNPRVDFLHEDERIEDFKPTIKKIIINEVSDKVMIFDDIDKQFITTRDLYLGKHQEENDKQEYKRLKKKFENKQEE